MSINLRWFVIPSLVLTFSGPAYGNLIPRLDPRAVSDMGGNRLPLGPRSTYDLKAHSVQTFPVAAGPNAATEHAPIGTTPPPPIPAAPGLPGETIDVKGGGVGGVSVPGRTYAPVVGVLNAPKLAAGSDYVSSTSGGTRGYASITFGPGGSLFAFALVPTGVGGAAAGEAVDPITLGPGSYAYSIIINRIELETATGSDFAASNMYATDSRFSDRLWELAISAQGPILSKDDLQIGFTSQPLLGLNDSLIRSQIFNNITVNASVATLTNFTLFSTTYVVDQEIEYSEGSIAAAQVVPEPSTMTLALAGLALGLLSLLRAGGRVACCAVHRNGISERVACSRLREHVPC